jgi:peptidoglycan/xylan/chitin deacetylase (PgdA/CDA1 family)
VELFRPPYEGHDARVDSVVRTLGMVEVLWSIDSRDSEGAAWYQIVDNSARLVSPGSIVLIHENRGQTVRALDYRLLRLLRRRGLTPVTVPELLALDPPTQGQLLLGQRGCGSAALAPRARTDRAPRA